MRAFEIRPSRRRLALLLALCACVPLGHAAYMDAKAGLAQVLLRNAWEQHQLTGKTVKPWPWADMSPVARLRVARLGIDEIVLSGDSGRTLAFGPGWAESSARPGASGLSVISAHRDTHFAFLRKLSVGDAISVDTRHNPEQFRVASTRIVDARHERIDTAVDADALLLVTCYPFDALERRGSASLCRHRRARRSGATDCRSDVGAFLGVEVVIGGRRQVRATAHAGTSTHARVGLIAAHATRMHAAVAAAVRKLPFGVLAVALVTECLAQLLRGLGIDALAFGALLGKQVGIGGAAFAFDAVNGFLLLGRGIGQGREHFVGIRAARLGDRARANEQGDDDGFADGIFHGDFLVGVAAGE